MSSTLSLLRQSLTIYVRHPLTMVLIAAVGLPVNLVVIESGFTSFLWQIGSLILGELVFASLTYAAATAHAGENPNFLQSYRVALTKIGTLVELLFRQLGAVLLLAITVVGIPFAIRILARWFFGSQGVILHNLRAKEAISLSCRLVQGRWWQVAGTVLFIGILFGGPPLVLRIAWGFYSMPSLILGSTLSLIVGPILAAFWTLFFFRLGDEAAIEGGIR